MLIYKIFRPLEWATLKAEGQTSGAPIDVSDGYIHFSTATQVAETLSKHFAGEEKLWLIALEADALDALKWEPSRGGALFPHLYRAMTMEDVLWSKPIGWDGSTHILPEGVE